jgi:hypothetical protein
MTFETLIAALKNPQPQQGALKNFAGDCPRADFTSKPD